MKNTYKRLHVVYKWIWCTSQEDIAYIYCWNKIKTWKMSILPFLIITIALMKIISDGRLLDMEDNVQGVG